MLLYEVLVRQFEYWDDIVLTFIRSTESLQICCTHRKTKVRLSRQSKLHRLAVQTAWHTCWQTNEYTIVKPKIRGLTNKNKYHDE